MSTVAQTDLAELLRRDKVHHNLAAAPLVEHSIQRGEADDLAAAGRYLVRPAHEVFHRPSGQRPYNLRPLSA